MDVQFFIDTLNRRKWLLIGTSLIAGLVTLFVMLEFVDEKYRANTQVKQGIIDYRGPSLTRVNGFVQKFQIETEFSNRITGMTGRDQLNKLTEVMLHHDLTSPRPFRTPSPEELAEAGVGPLDDVRAVLISRRDSADYERPPLFRVNDRSVTKLAEAYRYDFDALREQMDVKRIGDTDFLDISFVTEDPELSYFLVTRFTEMFIEDFTRQQSSEELKELEFYTANVREKKLEIDSLQTEIDRYRRGKAVVDLDEQQRAVVGQLRDIESDIEERRKEIRGYENALAAIRADRTTAGRSKADRTARIAIANARLDRVKRELSELNVLLDDNDSPALRRQIAEKKAERDEYIERVATLKRLGEAKVDDRIVDLQQQELEAEIELEAARRAVTSMQSEARRLRGRRGGLVNDEAYLAQLSTELGILRQEYKGLLEQRDEAEVIYKKSEQPLVIVEPAEVPEEHESRHIPLVAAFSAVSTGTLMALGLFLFTLLDNRLRSPDQLRTLYGKEAFATLTAIRTKKYGLRRLFGAGDLPAAEQRWIEGIRNLRYGVEQSGKRVVQVTSLGEGAGKSTVAAGLATALTRANNKVLLLDLNFKRNTLSAYANVPAAVHPFEVDYDESLLPRASGWFEIEGMDVVGNLGGNRSLAEVLSASDFAHKLAFLAEEYDYLVLETAALDLYADARELAEYSEGILCVLDADSKLDGAAREAMTWLEAQGGQFVGYVLNRVELKMLK